MVKIGIITRYYESTNYGGNFQAYALVKLLNKNDYYAEQICCLDGSVDLFALYRKKTIKYYICEFIRLSKLLLYKIYFMLLHKKRFVNFQKEMKQAFSGFSSSIPHTNNVYNCSNINQASDLFDCFITGSDQVWNLSWYSKAYFLSFVEKGKKKIAYGASLGNNRLTDEQQKIISEHIVDFNAISVREGDAVDLIQPLTDKQVKLVLDPTLLLSKEDWDNVCSDKIITDKYVCCYFLGNNANAKKTVKAFAKKHGYKIINIPMSIKDIVRPFGENIIASPNEFLSLIKYSEYVFTDSFHAVVFSKIYKKQYFVFNRNHRGDMNSRIYNITDLFNTKERFCDTADKENISYIESLKDIDYDVKNDRYEELKRESIEFLLNSIQD